MHCRRLTWLTNAFSKKLENFKAAVALHYGYYSFVNTDTAIRCTPAMQAGVTDSAWTVAELVEINRGLSPRIDNLRLAVETMHHCTACHAALEPVIELLN